MYIIVNVNRRCWPLKSSEINIAQIRLITIVGFLIRQVFLSLDFEKENRRMKRYIVLSQ